MGWHLGNHVLGNDPTIIAAVRDDATPQQLHAALASGVHAIELRIDAFAAKGTEEIVQRVQALALGPSLATIRHANEGGEWRGDEAVRLALYRAVLPFVDAVDCELSNAEVAEPLFAEAAAQGKLSIGSFHDFRACPDSSTLSGLITKGESVGADIVKVAAFCGSSEEFRRLAMFTIGHADKGVVVIAMGPAGMPSRVLFPALGSLLTYTFIGMPTAPGQLNWQELVEYVNVFYGRAAQ